MKVKWLIEYSMAKLVIIYLRTELMIVIILYKTLKNHGVIAFVSSKKNRVLPIPHDRHIYKKRHAVECFFQKIKRFRRIATRYDKTARMYLTGILFVSILAILKL
jgi:transposase